MRFATLAVVAALVTSAIAAPAPVAAANLEERAFGIKTKTKVVTVTAHVFPKPAPTTSTKTPAPKVTTSALPPVANVPDEPVPTTTSTSTTPPPPPPPPTTTSTTTPPPPPPPPTTSTTTTPAPAQTTPASSSGGDSTGISSQVLAAHNKHRAKFSIPQFTYDADLENYAASSANLQSCSFAHTGGPHGENLAAGYGSIDAAVQAWYDEHTSYSYGSPGFSGSTGHFTQVVWKGSTKVGCALKSCNGSGGTPGSYLMCEYDPPGNFLGQFEENVLQPISGF